MTGKKLYLISNAHIDPVWQWEWEEGAAETVSTFRVAANFCETVDGYIFCHNEALLYQWVEEYEPELFAKIQALVRAGRWHIMGGWYLQPDCNMPSGEAIVRQALVGRRYFWEKFGVAPTTAINFDPFGHSRGLVQILKKAGYDSYIFTRPNPENCPLPASTFRWVGYDGSSVKAHRAPCYNTGLGHAVDGIQNILNLTPAGGINPCLWGVGDHGGGASKKDLDAIAVLMEQMKAEGIEIQHSTPEEYFSQIALEELPEHRGDLNPWAPGCYTSQVRIKQKYCQLEAALFMTEKMCAAAHAAGLIDYPGKELLLAQNDMLMAQFHDYLPGSSIQPAEESGLRQLDHGLEILSKLKARAFFALAKGQRIAAFDEIPILVYNPHPYPVEKDIECEFMLWDINFEDSYHHPTVYSQGRALPSQPEKEHSNIPADWRKRVVFHATLEPMQMNRFDCKLEKRLGSRPKASLPEENDCLLFESGRLRVTIGKKTGLVESFQVDGRDYLQPGAFGLDVMRDSCDPWGMTVRSYREKVGGFSLLSPEEGARFSGLSQKIDSVRVIEDGPVRTVVEAVFGYENSRALLRYYLSKNSPELGLEVRILWNEKQKMVKLRIPSCFSAPACLGEVMYGTETFPTNGRENVAQRHLRLQQEGHCVYLINDGVYGSSVEQNVLLQTLLHSAAYTAHPLGERKVLPEDRFSPYMEQGERIFHFCFGAGSIEEIVPKLGRRAQAFVQAPMALSFFPCGEGSVPQPGIQLRGDGVELCALKRSEEDNSYILRLFNPTDTVCKCEVSIPVLNISGQVEIGAFEMITLRADEKAKALTICPLLERDFSDIADK